MIPEHVRARVLQIIERYDVNDADATHIESSLSGGDETRIGDVTVTGPMVSAVADVADVAAPPATSGAPAFGRYEDLGPLGRGAVGLVYRVRDPALKRTMALKVLKPELRDRAEVRSRFVEEAQVSAQLQHPGLAPVHELGELPDGRYYFTMKEVQGRTLMEVFQEVHAASNAQEWRPGPSGWNLRRMLTAFRQVCDAMAYAHSRGVVHRDLKPQNVMVGDFGEVLVLDWGLAKLAHQAEPLSVGAAGRSHTLDVTSSMETRYGDVRGTPAFMSPEQARGEVDQVGPASDVYGLGAVLYFALTAQRPHRGDTVKEIIAFAAAGRAPDFTSPFPVPEALWDILRRAMAPAPLDRFPDAAALAQALSAWLEGEQQREQARKLIRHADALRPRIQTSREAAKRLRSQARALLDALPPNASVHAKRPGWRMEDQSEQREKQARLLELEFEQTLRSALNLVPDLHAAHERLAEWYREGLEYAEAQRDTQRSEVLLALINTHDQDGRHAPYLRGDGALTLHTDPPGAEVRIQRYVLRDRRLVLDESRILGRTPIDAASLPMGSYLCELRAPGRQLVRYPVFIERGRHWDGVPPGNTLPEPVHLPRLGDLHEDDVYVPQGWFVSGGAPEKSACLPRQRLWMYPFVIKRYACTLQRYQDFLNSQRASLTPDAIEALVPRQYEAMIDGVPKPWFVRSDTGEWVIDASGAEPLRGPTHPVTHTSHAQIEAFLHWVRRDTNQPWRLCGELEWEKAARGVDGRRRPWGDFLEPAWFNGPPLDESPPKLLGVHERPEDESPHGLRGVMGTLQSVCVEPFSPERRELTDAWPVEPPSGGPAGDVEYKHVVRGGSYIVLLGDGGLENRVPLSMKTAWPVIGLRLARPYTPR